VVVLEEMWGYLHMWVMPDIALAAAFILSFIAVFTLRNYAGKDYEAKGVRYVYLGLGLGGVGWLVLSLLQVYLVKLPVLLIVLYEKGVPAQEAVNIFVTYMMIFPATRAVSMFTATGLIAYGVSVIIMRRR